MLRSSGRRYDFSVVLPFLRIEGPASVAGGDRVVIIGGAEQGVESRSGPGDVVLRGELFVAEGDGRRRPWVSLIGRVKVPTASDRDGLGTGEFDLSAGVGLVQPLGGRAALFADLVRKRVGDPPGVDFQDTTAASLGVSVRLGRALSVWAMLDREDSYVRGLEDGESLSGGVMIRPHPDWRISAALFHGLSDTREDSGVMLGLARSWDVRGR